VRSSSESVAFIARWSPWRIALIDLGAAAFVLGGLGLVGAFGPVHPHRGTPQMLHVIGWASIVFFGLCLIVATKRLIAGGSACKIDSDGILESRISSKPIPWQMITNMRVVTISSGRMLNPGQRMIGFDIAKDYTRRFSFVRRQLIAFNRNAFGFSAALSPVGTDRSLADFLDALQFWAPDKLQGQTTHIPYR
jgi:hypothetical protein